MDSLFPIQQQDEEDLRKYVAHFNATTLKLKNFNESVVMSALKRRLQSNRLVFSLNKNFSNIYDEMLDRMHKYAQAEKEAILRQVRNDKNGKKRSTKNNEVQ